MRSMVALHERGDVETFHRIGEVEAYPNEEFYKHCVHSQHREASRAEGLENSAEEVVHLIESNYASEFQELQQQNANTLVAFSSGTDETSMSLCNEIRRLQTALEHCEHTDYEQTFAEEQYQDHHRRYSSELWETEKSFQSATLES